MEGLTISLKDIEDVSIVPPKGLVRSMKSQGQIHPIVLRFRDAPFSPHSIVDGRRRVAAARRLEWESIQARGVSFSREDTVVSLLSNLQRSPNPIEEGDLLAQLLTQEQWTVKLIVQELGIPKARIRQRLDLHNRLHPGLKMKVLYGKMSLGAAQLALKLDESAQTRLACQKGRVTQAQVQAAFREKQMALLDLDSIEIPPVESDLQVMVCKLTEIAMRLSGAKKEVLLEAAMILEGLG